LQRPQRSDKIAAKLFDDHSIELQILMRANQAANAGVMK
jgi:hypothetical protein